jgi:hypothetical protein
MQYWGKNAELLNIVTGDTFTKVTLCIPCDTTCVYYYIPNY